MRDLLPVANPARPRNVPPQGAATPGPGLRFGVAPHPAQILSLQRTLGNRAVQRLIAGAGAPRGAERLQRVVVPITSKGLKFGTPEQQEDSADVARGASGLRKRDGGHGDAAGPTPLAGIANGEKIYLHGHGAPGELGGYSATELLAGLKDMGLRKNYSGTIVLASCQSGVHTGPLGVGASLAGELAGLLSGEEYEARVEGMTGNVIIDDRTGELRVVTDAHAFDAAREEWLPRYRDYQQRREAYTKHPVGPSDELDREEAALTRQHREFVEANSVAYEDGGTVLRRESDSQTLLAGGIVVGLLAAGLGLFKYYHKG